MPISLAASQVETQTVGGSTIDTANAAVASSVASDLSGNMSFTIAKGSPASNAFSGSSRTKEISVSVNLLTGAWQSSNGQSGVLSGAALTTLNNQLKAFRNQLETFASNNVFPGSATVAWT